VPNYLRYGSEFSINTTYARTQAQADLTRLANGNIVAVWVDADFNTTSNRYIRAQIYTADGTATGTELSLAAPNGVINPAIAGLVGGGFVVTWNGLSGFKAQIFSNTGVAVGGVFAPVAGFPSSLDHPDIVALTNGGFVISWQDNRTTGSDISGSGVHLRAFDSLGNAVGTEVLVNTATQGNQADASITSLANGGYVVTWTDRGSATGWLIKAQVFNGDGSRGGGEFVVNGAHSGFISSVGSSVTSLANGNFAVAWYEGGNHHIQIFSTSGARLGQEILITAGLSGVATGPVIAALSDGGLAIAWTGNISPLSDGSGIGVFTQVFDASGHALGNPLQANSQANGDQIDPSIVALDGGAYLLSWTDLNGSGADDDQVRAQIFSPPSIVTITSNGGGDTAAISVLENLLGAGQIVALSTHAGAHLTYSIVGGDDAARFSIDPITGALTFQSGPDFEAATDSNHDNVYDVIVSATDGLSTDAQALAVTVQNVNEAPALTGTQAVLAHAAEDTPNTISSADLLSGFSDPEGDSLAVTGLTASNGSIADNGDGTFTVTPTADYNGPVTLNYAVSDGHGGTAAASLGYTIDPVNDAPGLAGAQAVLAHAVEDTPYIVSAAALLSGFSDVDGDSLTVIGLTASDGSIADNGDGTFTVTPTADYNGPVTLNYTVSDGHGGTVAASLGYMIDPVNDAPVLSGAQAVLAHAAEDAPYIISAAALLSGFSDVDGDSLTVIGLTASNGSIADNGDGTFTVTPTADYNGPVTLSYAVSDGHGGTVAASLGYTIDPVNDAPRLTGAQAVLAHADEDAPYIVSAADLLSGFSDVEGDSLAVTSLTASNGSIVDNGDGTFTVTPTADYTGPVTLNYAVGDGHGGTVAASLSYTVDPVNDAPFAIALSETRISENLAAGSLVGIVSASDPDVGDSLRYSLVNAGTAPFAIDAVSGAITTTATLDYETLSQYVLHVQATDSGGLGVAADYTIQVSDVANRNYAGTSSANVFTAQTAEEWTIAGLAGNDSLTGNANHDVIIGGTGSDILHGEGGDDVFLVGVGDGTDSFDGGAGYDKIVATAANVVIGISGISNVEAVSSGGFGGVSIAGSTIGDTLDFSDVVLDGIARIDGLAGNDTIIGSVGNDSLFGGAGNDMLIGGTGNDLMDGGTGNDIFVVGEAGDLVVEASGGGTDTVQTTLATYALTANVENLTYIGAGSFNGTGNALANILIGGDSADSLYGLAGDDKLYGGAGVDSLYGDDGNDTLDGGIGADHLEGGLGNDIYWVDDSSDAIVEAVGAGTDVVNATAASYVLSDNIENLTFTGTGAFTGTGNALANTLNGGAGNDGLYGGDGNDTLNGGTGADHLEGGLGNDVYWVDDSGDAVVEDLNGGTDTVKTGLSSYTLSDNVETLTFTGTGAFTGTGNALGNTLNGGAGDDVLAGMAGKDSLVGGIGNDWLIGGTGADTLTGGVGNDVFVFDSLTTSTDKDTIKDYVTGEDHLDLSRSVFAAFGDTPSGDLPASAFALGTAATDANQHLIYNNATGALYYDPDGAGGLAQIQIAIFSNHPTLSAMDFHLF